MMDIRSFQLRHLHLRRNHHIWHLIIAHRPTGIRLKTFLMHLLEHILVQIVLILQGHIRLINNRV